MNATFNHNKMLKSHCEYTRFVYTHISVSDYKALWLALADLSQEAKCSNNSRTCRHRTSSARVRAWFKMANNSFSATYLIIVTNWLMVSSWGTRNFVLSSNGRSFSLWYLSTMTWKKATLNKWNLQRCLPSNGLI